MRGDLELQHRLPEHARPHLEPRRDRGRGAARRGLRDLRGRQVAPVPDGGRVGRRPVRPVAAASGASTASTASSTARPTSSPPTSSTTTTASTRRRPPRTATTSARTWSTTPSGSSTTPTSVRPDRPFFCYLAFGATHAPHQAPAEYLDEVPRAASTTGWDVARERVVRPPARAGPRPEGTELAPRNPGVEPWDDAAREPAPARGAPAGGVRRVPRPHRRPDRPASSTPSPRSASSTTRSSSCCPTTAPARRAGRSASCTR